MGKKTLNTVGILDLTDNCKVDTFRVRSKRNCFDSDLIKLEKKMRKPRNNIFDTGLKEKRISSNNCCVSWLHEEEKEWKNREMISTKNLF